MVWEATVPEILLAWEAKVDFTRNTNPFGSSKSKTSTSPPAVPENESKDDRRARIKAQMRRRKDLDK